MVPAALILWALVHAGGSAPVRIAPPEPARAPAGLRLVIESLDLALTTPDRWRISTASTPDELVLLAGTERAPLHLRVRRDLSARLPRELMRELALELGAPYSEVEFESEETRPAGEREVLIVSASRGDLGVRLFVVALSPAARHLFWLDGGARDVRRAFDEVLACIAGAGPVVQSAAGAQGVPVVDSAIVHRASGLVVERHPAGLEPLSVEPEALDGEGLAWAAGEPEAAVARLTLTRRSVGPMVDEATAAGSLGSELRRDAGVSELASSRERLANMPARRVSWRRGHGERALAFETWFFKAGSSLFRLELEAQAEWLTQNQAALEDFRRGLRFVEQE